MQRMPGKTLDEIPQLHAAVVTAPAAGETLWLLLVRLEEAQEGGVLAQQVFDLRHAGARPVLDPRLGQVILDVMKAAFVHTTMIDQEGEAGNGPGGSFGRHAR